MQVSFVQYSDDAKTEFKLNTYHDKGMVLSAVQMVSYRGGNTKTGYLIFICLISFRFSLFSKVGTLPKHTMRN